jgi:hypothetical protein
MGGWSDVKDVGDRESRRYARCWADTIGIGGLSSAIYSYDLHAYCGSQEYFIEVKVSLSLGASHPDLHETATLQTLVRVVAA